MIFFKDPKNFFAVKKKSEEEKKVQGSSVEGGGIKEVHRSKILKQQERLSACLHFTF